MEDSFKDYFSLQAGDYARFRPHYPAALFENLAKACHARNLAWDCGTGNGQAAVALASFFARVIATDPSSGQISQAVPAANVEYRQATAEKSGLETNSADLITVAQAFHWLQQDAFFSECKRVGKPGAVFAVWCYELTTIEPAVDAIVMELYRDILGAYWDPKRKLVEEGYRNEKFPFEELNAPQLEMTVEWTITELLGYLGTWSAIQKYRKETEIDPRISLLPRLQKAWGAPSIRKRVSWPLSIRMFRLQ